MHSPRPARVGRGRSPRPSWRGDLRPFLAPAVVQASAMDCGPAALSALLAGHGVAASPDRLREMCRTDVDGTSIDALAVAARRHGLDCSQVVVPVEHLTHSDRLPALAVTRRADGLTHVVVVWRRHRRWFQVMDPAVGRRLMRHRRLLELLHVHEQAVPVATYARIASTGSFRSGLLARIRALGIADAEALVARAAGDGAATARLDAAVRGAARGRCHGRSATRAVLAALADPAAIDDTAWYARPGRPGSATVTLRGAVLLQPRPAPTGRPALTPPTAPTPSAATGTSRRTGPGRNRAPVAGSVGAVLPAGDGRIVRRLAVGAALAGVGATAEVALLGTALDRGGQVAPLLAVAIFGALLAGIELSTARAALLVGRRLDLGVRRWLAQQLHRIPDRYLRTRAASDLAERAHSVHLLRRIPAAGAAGLGAAARLVATTVGLCVLAPGHSPLVVALALVLVACTGATLPARREIELHRQETAGALAQLELDVLLSTRHGPPADTADALAGEHGRRLAAWRRATRVAARGRAATVGLQAGVAAAGTVAVAGAALAGLDGAGTELLFLVWLAGMATAVEELTAALVRWPEDRAVAGRLGDLLAATRAGPEPDLPSTHPARAPGPGTDPTVTTRPREGSVATAATEATGAGGPDTGPVATPSVDVTGTGGPSTGVDLRTTSAPGSGTAVELRGVTVAVAGRTVLDHVDLKVPPGQHVALVGRSGAGKSSILEVVLGLQAPVEGDVRLDGRPPAGGGGHRSTVAWVGAETRLWDRSIEANVAGPDRDAALDACGLVDLAARLDGDNVGDDGARLSLDERQRLRLARALAQPGVHLAVVDEALRHATPAARRALLSRARRSWAAATVLCATHDIDLAATFDRVVVVEGGTIVEDGRPDELLRRPGSRLAALHRADRDVRQRLGALHGSSPAPHDGPAALHGGPAPSSALEPGTSGNPTGGDRHPGRARTVAVTGGPTPNVPATDEPNPTVAANDEPPGRAHRPARRRPLVARAALAAAVHGARHLTMGLAWVLVAGPILADGRGGATSEWALALAATAAQTAAAAWIEVDLGASVAARWRSRMLAHALAAGGNGVGAEGPAR
ncbi:MAG: cysteine peptidase family C39 domain-containing protein, partial [Acidimicrobiia bacterium]